MIGRIAEAIPDRTSTTHSDKEPDQYSLQNYDKELPSFGVPKFLNTVLITVTCCDLDLMCVWTHSRQLLYLC